MHAPLAREGLREIVLVSLLAAAGVVAGVLWYWPVAVAAGVIGVAGLAFFRDPRRRVPDDPAALLAPADGRVTEVSQIENDPLLGGPATRIGIFLSVFDVHINRSPCAGRVESVVYRRGRFRNAMLAASSSENESNTILMTADEPLGSRLVVRQVAGLIARRIVCTIAPGDTVAAGGKIGMIKFGSRTELILPQEAKADVLIKVGDTVRAGTTIVARWGRDAETKRQSAVAAPAVG